MVEKTIVILIDALGFTLAGERGFVPAGLPHRSRVRTVLGFSQAAIATILTGLDPWEHGFWMMYAFSPRGGPLAWLRLLPRSVSTRRRWLRRLVAWDLRVVHGVRGYFSLYDVPREVLPYLEIPARGNIFEPGGGGSTRTILDDLAAADVPFRVWDYRVNEGRSFEELEKAVSAGKERTLFLYAAGLDSDLHRFGRGDARIAERLDLYRRRIEKIEETARASGGARIFVLGDHGMCDVRSTIDVMGRVDSLGLGIPGDYIPFYDSTMARFKVFSKEARSKLEICLGGIRGGRFLGEEELRALGGGGGGGKYGDLVFLAESGVVLAPSHMGEGAVAAMHGYHPDVEDMYSVMLSNVPLPAEEMSLASVAGVLHPGFTPGGGARR